MREHYLCARGTLGPLDVEPDNRGGENTSESISCASAHRPTAFLLLFCSFRPRRPQRSFAALRLVHIKAELLVAYLPRTLLTSIEARRALHDTRLDASCGRAPPGSPEKKLKVV
jgi:hypothetical protein